MFQTVEICSLLWAAVTTYSFEWKNFDQDDEQSTTKQSTILTTMNYVGVILTSMTEYMAPSLEDCGRRTWGMGLLCSISFLFSRFISSRLSTPFFTFTDHSGSSASCWMSRTLPRTYLYKNRYQWLDNFEVHVFRKQQYRSPCKIQGLLSISKHLTKFYKTVPRLF